MKNHAGLRRSLYRGVLVLLLIALLGGVLTACSGGSRKATTVKKNNTLTAVAGENGLTTDQLNSVADAIVSNKKGFEIREMLVAALNGYDMTAEGFDDSKVAIPGNTPEGAIQAQPEKAAEYAASVLSKYEITLPLSTGQVLTRADVEDLVNCFAVKVEVNEKLGVFDQILHWIGLGFEWLINVPGFGSFLLGTLYFAILLEIVMLPIGIHQQKNSRKQARLRPKEMAIRNKYKGRNDQATMQKVNQEIQNLYTKEGYSPMAGCLPLLITLPFLMFLYYIVIDPLIYMMGASRDLSNAFLTFADASRAAGGLGLSMGSSQGTIEVLSLIKESGISLDGLSSFAYFTNGSECLGALDGMVDRIPDFTLLGMNMGLTPKPFGKPYVLMLIPVLTFVVYFASGKISRKFSFQPMQNQNDPSVGCSNTMMNVMMPLMSAFFTFMVPAAVGIYWMFKSVISTVKQIVIYKVMPLPVFTEEDYKAAERELMGKEKNKPVKKSGTRNPNVRSLHHIDDEDYETGDRPALHRGADKPDYVEPEEPEAPKTAAGEYGEGLTLKEDDRPAAKEKKKRFGKKSEETDSTAENTEDTDSTDNA